MSLFATVDDAKTPVFVLTGFLGSGKTTLLNRLVRAPECADTAVIVNELGAVALDHLLVEKIDGEVALLRSGCICCTVRGDFEDTLRELLARRDEGSVPPFARVVVETTGLADPAPLVQAVDTNPLLAHFCRIGGVLTTIDAVNGCSQMEHQWEARKQAALADTLLITKTDLAAASEQLLDRVHALNAHAERLMLTAATPLAPLLAPRAVAAYVERVAERGLFKRPIGALHGEVNALVLESTTPLDWSRLHAWLAELRARDGERLLRLKGVVSIEGEPAPLVLHGVQHLFHPPLSAPNINWQEGRSVLVLITRGLQPEPLRTAFDRCQGTGKP